MTFDAVIFDMDGLMLDSERLALDVWREVGTRHGLAITDELCIRMVGRNEADSEAILVAELGDLPLDALRTDFAACYDAMIEAGRLQTKSGIFELLAALDAAGIRRAVATSTRRERAERKLARAGLLPWFELIVGGDDVARPKPAPDIFLAAASRLGIAPERCLVLEDSNSGVAAATAGGFVTVMVPDLQPPNDESRARASQVFPSLHEVRSWLARISHK